MQRALRETARARQSRTGPSGLADGSFVPFPSRGGDRQDVPAVTPGVVDRVHHLAHEKDAETSGAALLDGHAQVRLRRFARIVGMTVVLDARGHDAVVD